ncbi:MAG: hypothetical protein ACTHJQ_25320 [Rhizobiaceae bacterium]
MTDTTGLDANACAADAISDEEREIRKLRHEVEMLMGAGIIEVAVRNPNVAEYMKHWEDRALKAEAAVRTAHSSGVKVKPLDWLLFDDDWWTADTIIGGYEVRQGRASARTRFPGNRQFEEFPGTLDDAKATAQSDFERRILSSLSPAEAGAGDVKGYAIRLLIALMERHYPDRSPEWAPLPDLYGVLTQIDNLSTGLVRAPAEAGVEGDAKRLVPEYALDWLFGQGPDKNGQWFGDVPGKGAFWWRSQFRAMLEDAALTHPSPLEECREVLRPTEDMITAAFNVFSGKMLMHEEDRDLIERMISAALKASPSQGALRACVEFYANPENWIDTPPWDGDPDCITPKAIPVYREDGNQICDCGNHARRTLAGAEASSKEPIPVAWAFNRPDEPYLYFTTNPDADNLDRSKLTPLYTQLEAGR